MKTVTTLFLALLFLSGCKSLDTRKEEEKKAPSSAVFSTLGKITTGIYRGIFAAEKRGADKNGNGGKVEMGLVPTLSHLMFNAIYFKQQEDAEEFYTTYISALDQLQAVNPIACAEFVTSGKISSLTEGEVDLAPLATLQGLESTANELSYAAYEGELPNIGIAGKAKTYIKDGKRVYKEATKEKKKEEGDSSVSSEPTATGSEKKTEPEEKEDPFYKAEIQEINKSYICPEFIAALRKAMRDTKDYSREQVDRTLNNDGKPLDYTTPDTKIKKAKKESPYITRRPR